MSVSVAHPRNQFTNLINIIHNNNDINIIFPMINCFCKNLKNTQLFNVQCDKTICNPITRKILKYVKINK